MMWLIAIWIITWVFSFAEVHVFINFRGKILGMAIAPLIFLDATLERNHYLLEAVLKHERVHLLQARMLSPLIFIVLYSGFFVVQFVYFIIKLRNWKDAYFKAYFYNPFEIHARKKAPGVIQGLAEE